MAERCPRRHRLDSFAPAKPLVCADALFIQGSRQAIGMCARGVRVALPSRAHGDWACSTCQCISIGGTIPAARPFQIPFVPLRSTRPLTQSSSSIDSIGAHRQLATMLQHAAAAQLRVQCQPFLASCSCALMLPPARRPKA